MDSRDVIEAINEYFAHRRRQIAYRGMLRFEMRDYRNIIIERAVKHPSLRDTYFVHIVGGITHPQARQVICKRLARDQCDYNNIAQLRDRDEWSLLFRLW